MSEKTKYVGAGAIISPLLIAFLVGVTGLFGTWASKVPELETTVKLEFGHINTSIHELTQAQIDTNNVIKEHARSDTRLMSVVTETLMGHDYMIKQLIKDQDRNK